MARSLPNLDRVVSRLAHIQFVLKVKVKVKGHVIQAVLCQSRKSLLLADKWPDCDQTYTRWSPGQRESRMCSTSRSRSKVTCYRHFCVGTKKRFSSQENGRIVTKLAHDGLQVVHPGCAQFQGQGQRSRDTGTLVFDLKSLFLASKWFYCDQTCTQWSPGQPAFRLCSRSRSKVT